MTTGIFFVGVAAIAVLLLMQLFGRRSQALLVAGAALATICIGVGAVRFSSADGGMRLSAEVLRFNGSVDRPVDVTIGGDQLRDELYVRRTTTGVAQTVLEGLLRLRTDDNDDVSLTVRRFGAAPITAVVQIDDTIIGEAPMTSNAEICLRACDRDSAVWIRYDEARNVLVTADGRASGFDLVRRQGSLGLPSPRDWTAVDRIYPLRYFAPPDRTPDAEEGREQVQSFLFRRRDGSLHFVLLDASARMRGVAGAEILGDDRQAAARLCADGEGCVSEAKVRIYEVRFGDPPSQTQTPSRGYLTEMRSFDIVAAPERSVLLRLDTPDSIVLTASDMETESRRLSELGTEASVRIGAGSRLSTDSAFSTVGFTSLGGGFLRDIDHRLLLGDVAAIAYGSQRTEVRSGFSVSMGDRFEAIVRIDKLDSNWPLLGAAQVIIFLGGLVSLLATWRARTASPVTFALFAALDLLLMLRVLVGLQAAFVDPGVEAQAAPVHAFATYLLGPLLLSLVSPATYAAPMRLAAHAGFVAIALVWLHRDIGALDLPFVVISGVGVASALIGALLALPLRTFSMPRFKLSGDAGMNWTLFSAVVALFFLARVVLALSNQEAISLLAARA